MKKTFDLSLKEFFLIEAAILDARSHCLAAAHELSGPKNRLPAVNYLEEADEWTELANKVAAIICAEEAE